MRIVRKELAVVAMILAVTTVSAVAVNRAWDAGGADNDWSNPSNWTGNVEPLGIDTPLLGFTPNANPADAVISQSGERGFSAYVGYTGGYTGFLQIAGGELVLGQHLYVGYNAGSFGRVTIQPGGVLLITNDLFVGHIGTGEFLQQEGTEVTTELAGGGGARRFKIGTSTNATGTYTMSGGVFRAHNVPSFIGEKGRGSFYQYGGTNYAGSMYIGESQPATGKYVIAGGELIVSNSLYVGGGLNLPAGNGTLEVGAGATVTCYGEFFVGIGDGQGTCILRGGTVNALTNSFYSVRIQGAETNSTPPESGTLRGWGNLNVANNLFMDGYCIADGFGQERTLYITNYTHLRDWLIVTSAESNGWYAQNSGRLVLKPYSVTGNGSVYWADEDYLNNQKADAVNSVEVQLSGVSGSGTLDGSLYSTNRTDVPEYYRRSSKIAGIWSFEADGFAFASANLVIRYDHNAAAALGIDEADLKVYEHSQTNGSRWMQLTDYAVNTGVRKIIASNVTEFAFFAVGDGIQSPPPPQGTVVLIQ